MNKLESRMKPLCDLIASEIDANPFYLPGDPTPWAARGVEWWAEKLGKSERTIRNWITKAGNIVRDRALVDGKVTLVLRIGDPKAMTIRHMARILEREWKKKTDIPTTNSDFGRFVQLAKDWPAGYQPNILRHVLEDWSLFMSSVSYYVAMENEIAQCNGEKPLFKKKYFKFPSLKVIVWASPAAVESYEMYLQEYAPEAWSAFAKALAAEAA